MSPAEKWAQKTLEFGFIVSLLAIGAGFVFQLAQISNPEFFLKIGFWALLSTPTLRVVTLIFAFLHQKEKKLAWVAVGVLAILAASFMIEQF
jgi:uncharacterized membrane protein